MTAAITDFSQYTQLRSGAERNDPEALHEVARQFEALFLQTILKNMRAGELADPIFGDSDELDTYRDMMDQQLAVEMAQGRGIGFADMLVRQLGGEAESPRPTRETAPLAVVPAAPGATPSAVAETPLLGSDSGNGTAPAEPAGWADPESFVRDLWPHAQRIAKRLDVAPEGIVAQAALETGWGAHVMPGGDGSSSHNLFGIKADREWSGRSVKRPTVEYADGVARQRVEQFRAYDDISDNFEDYATIIEEDERYSGVTGTGPDVAGFAAALQDGGYATDPLYAAKIVRVLKSETMRSALHGLKTQ